MIYNVKKQITIFKIINNYKKYKKYFNHKINMNYKKYPANYYHKQNLENNCSYGIKVAICAIAKQENLYIEEFIEYYRQLGVNKIILYDNNDIDGENFNKLLNKEIKKNFIEIINYRGIISPQKRAYNDCYINNEKKFDWIAFYDIDEYLFIKNYENINKFLLLPKFVKCTSILINWRYYGDNNNIYYEPKPLQIRFSKPFEFSKNIKYNMYFYSAAKSIIRGGLKLQWAHFPHFLNSSNICSPDGIIIKNPFSPPKYSKAFIKHYATKSTEEYLMKLFKGNVIAPNFLNIHNIIYWISKYYFLFNKITKNKLRFIKRFIKLDITKYVNKSINL